MLTYVLETFTADRLRLVDSTGGVGSVYIRYSFQDEVCHYRVGISTVWDTSPTKQDSSLLFLHPDGSLVPGRIYFKTAQHEVYTSHKEAYKALTNFIAAGCPGLTLVNPTAEKAGKRAHKSAARAKKVEGLLRGMGLDDLVALRKAVDAAITKKTPKK